MPYNDPPWIPESSPRSLKYLGKLGEELGELSAAVGRCIIQGVMGLEPNTKRVNKNWLAEEVADVLAMLGLVTDYFELNRWEINNRAKEKSLKFKKWADED